jgi:hypothetical protein
MKVWASMQGRGLLWICLCLMLGQTQTAAAKEAPQCLSQGEVHGGYPRYRLVEGKRCWYASTRGPETNPADVQAKPEDVQAKPESVDVNPYDDPIWHEPDASNTQATAMRAKDCEEQALKLDPREKRVFMKQCMANRLGP